MIFKTIDADATNLTKKMGLLGKSFNDIKKDYSNGLGITKSLFSTSISESDWKSLQKFNSAIKVTNDGLTKSQRITKAWNENMTGCSIAAKRMGNDLVTGKKKISDVSSAMKTATASTKALEIAMNVFANVGFMLAITAVTKVISELAQAQSNAVETAKEATSAYNDELSSIKDYKEKISELNEELNSGNLSYEETKTKRSELMSIQDELIEKFGTEKSAIESVTEAIGGQVDALDDLNEKSYRDWIAKADDETIWTKLLPWGKSGLDQAIDYMESKKTVSFFDMANANSTTQDKYQAPITDEIRSIQEEIDKTIQSKYNLEKEFATFKLTGTPEEIKSQLESIRQDYLDLSKEAFLKNGISSEYWDAYRSEAIESINDVINQFDEGLEKHQETYKTYIEGMIKYDSEYSDEYATILRKRAELEDAENSGDTEKIQKARQEFMDAITAGITASESDENIKKYFESLYPELQAEFANWNFEIAINANTDNLKDEAEEIGKQYSATDLLDMINTEGVQEGEEAFNKLIDKAIEYGVCTDNSSEEVQKLIDLLVELGIVQGNIESDVQHETPISNSFKSLWKSLGKGSDDASKAIAEEKENLLKLAETGQLTEKAFSKSSIAQTFIDAGISIEEATRKLNKFVDNTKQLSSLKSGILSIQNAYSEKKEEKVVGADTFAGMESTFGKLDYWDKYKLILGSTKTSLAECREAQNKLATEYISSSNFLSQLTDKNKDYYVSQLKELGIANSQTIVENTLKANKEVLKNKTAALAAATSDLNNKTNTASEEFLKEANMSNLAKVKLTELIANEQVFSSQGLDLSEKISQLNQLASTYLGVSNAIAVSKSAMGADPRFYTDKWVNKQWNKLLKEKTKVSVDPVKVSPAKDKKSKDKNKSNEPTEIDWLSRRLTRMQSIIDLTATKFKNLFKIDEKENNINKQIKQTTQLIRQYSHAYDVYMAKFNKSTKASGKGKKRVPALSRDIIDKIISGEYTDKSYSELVKKYGKKMADKINNAIGYYDKAQDARKNAESQKTNRLQLKKDKIQLRIDEKQSNIDVSELKKEEAVTAKAKNKILDNEKKYYKQLYNQKIKQAKLDKDSVEVEKLKLERQQKIKDIGQEKVQYLIDEKQAELEVLGASKDNALTSREKLDISARELAKKKEIFDLEHKNAETDAERRKIDEDEIAYVKNKKLEDIGYITDEFNNNAASIDRDIAEHENHVNENEARGIGKSVRDYRKDIELSKEKQKNLRAEKEILTNAFNDYINEQKRLGNEVNESDSVYREFKDTISECDNGIADCIVDQLGFNKAINEMSTKNYEAAIKLLDMMSDKFERLQSLTDVHNSKMSDEDLYEAISIGDEKIAENNKHIDRQKNNLRSYLSEVLQMSSDDINTFMDLFEDNPHRLRGFMEDLGFEDFNAETYKDIFDYMTDINDVEGDIYSAMVDQEQKLDTIIQNRADVYNDILENLKKQKEYKDRVFAIEKAQYDLEKAKNNLTKKVWDGSQWVYTADTEAVQSAQEAFDNAQYDELVNVIQDVIDVLTKSKDDINIYDDKGDRIVKNDKLKGYVPVKISEIFKGVDMDKFNAYMASNVPQFMPVPDIKVPEYISNISNNNNMRNMSVQNININIPNITNASTGEDAAKAIRNELMGLFNYSKQYDWNK